MISTAVYIRVSTDEQAKEGYSIRAQEEKLRAYATLKEWNIYSVYYTNPSKTQDTIYAT